MNSTGGRGEHRRAIAPLGLRSTVPHLVLPLLADAGLVAVAFYLALLLRFEGVPPETFVRAYLAFLGPVIVVFWLTNALQGVYARWWGYASSTEATILMTSVGTATGVLILGDLLWGTSRPLPLSVVLIGGLLVLALFTGVRYRHRLLRGFLWRWRLARHLPGERVLVVGGGEGGELLARRLGEDSLHYRVVGFVDDDPAKHGRTIHGARVLGGIDMVGVIALAQKVDTIVLAMRGLSGPAVHDIVNQCEGLDVKIKKVPDVLELLESSGPQPLVRDVTVEDLLGREELVIDEAACRQLVNGKCVLVTGGAGSIGAELCSQLLRFLPTRIVVVDNNESALYDLQMRFCMSGVKVPVEMALGDVCRRERMEHLFQTWRPDLVFHCAAYKHVPLAEQHPEEAVLVNLLGTGVVTGLARQYEVERFVFISTDKAVEPVGVMGVCKKLGESLVLSMPANSKTRFTAVRFGNVLSSRGSVVPLFFQQIDRGGPVTVTHEEMTRYFMGLTEAVALIIQAATLTRGNDLFLLQMGAPVRIADLARKLIRLRGLRVDRDISLVFTGPRPGERLQEKLLGSGEVAQPTNHPYIFQVSGAAPVDHQEVVNRMERLVALAKEGNQQQLRESLDHLFGNALGNGS